MGKCKRVITFPLRQFDPAPFVDGNGEKSKYECIAIAVSPITSKRETRPCFESSSIILVDLVNTSLCL